MYMGPNLLMYALDQMNPVTGNPVDLAKAGMLLREARRVGGEAGYQEMQRAVMARRASYRAGLFLTQRKWQTTKTRRATRARHHDSLAIREKYVRIDAGGRKSRDQYPPLD